MPEFPAWLMYPGLGNDPPSAQMFGGFQVWTASPVVGSRQVSIEEATKKKREHDLAMGRRSNSAAFWPEGMAPAEPPAPIPEPPADRLEVGTDLWSNASVDPGEDNGWRP